MPVTVNTRNSLSRYTQLLQNGQDWGGTLRSLRESRGMSQRTLAAVTGINRNALRRFEDNGGTGPISMVDKLFRYFGFQITISMSVAPAPVRGLGGRKV